MTPRCIFTINDKIRSTRDTIDRITNELLDVAEQNSPGHRQRAANLQRSLSRQYGNLRDLEDDRDAELARLASDRPRVELTSRRRAGHATPGPSRPGGRAGTR